MNALPEPDSHYLRAAQGWLELGIHVEANEELERNVSVLQKSASVWVERPSAEFTNKIQSNGRKSDAVCCR